MIPSSAGSSRDSQSDEGSEHYFVPLSGAGFSRFPSETKSLPLRGSRLQTSLSEPSFLEHSVPHSLAPSKYSDIPDTFDDLDSFKDYDNGNGFLSVAGSNSVASDPQQSFYDVEDQVFSPPLLMDSSLLSDTYEDLLGTFIILLGVLYDIGHVMFEGGPVSKYPVCKLMRRSQILHNLGSNRFTFAAPLSETEAALMEH